MTQVIRNDDLSHPKGCQPTLEFVFTICYDENMGALEPGILKTFRVFIGVRLALVLNSLLYLAIIIGWDIPFNLTILIVFVVLDASLLFVYLSLPHLITLLKQRYLPIAIVWATIGPMAQIYLGFLVTKTNVLQQATYFMTPLPFLVMFIPLVIGAWQYSRRYVLYFCGLTFLVDCIVALLVFTVSTQSFLVLIGIALIQTILFLLIGNMITNLMAVQREQRQRLTEANDRLVHYAATMEQLTISRERNRMARELHDVMAHTMSGVAVELEGVRAMLKVNPEQAGELLGSSLLAIRGGLTEIRRALQALRSSPLEDLGLGLAIRNLVDSFPNSEARRIDLHIDGTFQGFSTDVEHCFYRVAQEALSNAVSHARASKVSVCLQQEDSLLRLSIQDNGIGFEQDSVDLIDKYGLLGMRERAEMIRGDLSIVSRPNSGTKIELTYGDRR